MINYLVIFISLLPMVWATCPISSSTNGSNFDVKIRLYYRTNMTTQFKEFNLKNESQNIKPDTMFNQTKPTVFIIHGFMQSPDSYFGGNITSAFLTNGTYNVLVLNYTVLAANYVTAYFNRGVVSQLIVQAIDNYLFDATSYPMSRFYLVGFSLGAQIAGQVGRCVKSGIIPRITGLEPAGPGFLNVANQPIVTPEDLLRESAGFVDVIHTDAGGYGYASSTGHADFWPNGGMRYQPGCSPSLVPFSQDDLCNHIRAWVLYVESMNNASAFRAWKADNYADFVVKSNTLNYTAASSVPMGYPANPSNHGNFYLYTKSSSPYGKGNDGTKP